MKEHEYQDAIHEIIFYFLAAPATILIGMFAVGAIIDTFMGLQNTFTKLFLYIGGIPGIAGYYYKRWLEFTKQAKLDITRKNRNDEQR